MFPAQQRYGPVDYKGYNAYYSARLNATGTGSGIPATKAFPHCLGPSYARVLLSVQLV